MKRIPIPELAWMRLRQRGRYCFAQNKAPIIWTSGTDRIPRGEPIYCIAWSSGQHQLVANKIISSNEVMK